MHLAQMRAGEKGEASALSLIGGKIGFPATDPAYRPPSHNLSLVRGSGTPLPLPSFSSSTPSRRHLEEEQGLHILSRAALMHHVASPVALHYVTTSSHATAHPQKMVQVG